MVKTVLERIEVSRTVDPNSYQIVYEVIDKDYTLYLEFNPETEIVQPDTREIVNAVNLVNVSWNVGMGLTPAFTATVDEADQDRQIRGLSGAVDRQRRQEYHQRGVFQQRDIGR